MLARTRRPGGRVLILPPLNISQQKQAMPLTPTPRQQPSSGCGGWRGRPRRRKQAPSADGAPCVLHSSEARRRCLAASAARSLFPPRCRRSRTVHQAFSHPAPLAGKCPVATQSPRLCGGGEGCVAPVSSGRYTGIRTVSVMWRAPLHTDRDERTTASDPTPRTTATAAAPPACCPACRIITWCVVDGACVRQESIKKRADT